MDEITRRIEEQKWLEEPAKKLQGAIGNAFEAGGSAGKAAENFLSGKWLGHPLHAAITDVPIGAWTVAAVLDGADTLSGSNKFAAGADAAVAIGLVGAVGSALSGMTDWHKAEGGARRVGLVHAALNITATGFYAASLVLRNRDARPSARVCSWFGMALVGASAFLGGSMVYNESADN